MEENSVNEPKIVENDKGKPQAAQVTQEEVHNLFQLPSVYVDHFYASPADSLIMLGFAQKTAGSEIKAPRFSCVMTYQRLIEFNNMLNGIIQQMTLQMMQAQKGQEKKPEVEREKLN